jgi:hypothetical protein
VQKNHVCSNKEYGDRKIIKIDGIRRSAHTHTQGILLTTGINVTKHIDVWTQHHFTFSPYEHKTTMSTLYRICLVAFAVYEITGTTASTWWFSSNNNNDNLKHESSFEHRRDILKRNNNNIHMVHRNLQVGRVGRVSKLRFVNAITGTLNGQSLLDPITNGTIINLSNYANRTFNIEAVVDTTNEPVGTIRFGFGATSNFRTEGGVPYAFCGDTNHVYRSCPQLAVVGSYTVRATPYNLTKAQGTIGQTYTVSFSIIDQPLQPIPSPTKVPTKAPTKTPTKSPTKIPTKSPISSALPAWIETDKNATGIDARHEACFVMVQRKAYLLAGRGIKPVNIYDPRTRTWTNGTAPPKEIHHTQCVAVDDSIWMVSSWTGGYPNEKNNDKIYVRQPSRSLLYFPWM